MTLSIRTQLLLALTAALLVGMGSYLALATRVVTQDKEAAVFEANAVVAASVAAAFEAFVEGSAEQLRYLGSELLSARAGDEAGVLLRRQELADAFLSAQDGVLAVELWLEQERGARFRRAQPAELEAFNLTEEQLAEARARTPVEAALVQRLGLVLENGSTQPDVGVLQLTVPAGALDGRRAYVTAQLRPERLLRLVQAHTVYRVSVVDSAGHVLVHPDARLMLARTDLSQTDVVRRALASEARNGALTGAAADGPVLAAFARAAASGATVLVEVPREVVFRATSDLSRRTLLFALGAAALALVLAVWASRRLTRPLRALEASMATVSRGGLGALVPVDGPRELRAVGEAFNDMSRRLLKRGEELAEANSQLVQSTKLAAVGELAASIAHEVKNPMVGIVGFSQLGQEATDPTEMREYFQLVEKDAQRANGILRNLLEFARPELEYAPADLNQLLKEAVALCRHQLLSAGAEVRLELFDGLPKIRANENQLKQVFLNLLMNAAQALEQSATKRITVITGLAGGQVLAAVQDTGPGIAPEIADRLFKPFVSTKPRGKGTGLGLSTSRGIVQAHEGDLKVVSEPGQGARFEVRLPPAQERHEPAE